MDGFSIVGCIDKGDKITHITSQFWEVSEAFRAAITVISEFPWLA